MSPYIIEGVTLVFCNGEREMLTVIESKETSRHPRIVREQILDRFSAMTNPPVDVELKIRWL